MEQKSLFENQENNSSTPLASRVRPETLNEFVGQNQIIGKGTVLRNLIEHDQISSLILWGPPGTGKTTLAKIIAHETNANFISVSAVGTSITKVRKIMQEAAENKKLGLKTIVFVDEIHRFNKAQQDAFLPYVENGSIILIGATTENPSFEINSALLSRSKVFVLKSLTAPEIVELLKQAIHSPKGYGNLDVQISDDNLMAIAEFANGDARSALNTLEMAVENGKRDGKKVEVTLADLQQLVTRKSLLYDKKGEEHYNIISAVHKSLRNSDVNAAVYWVTRMLDGGEDPMFIMRRLVRFASEDVGLADPQALNVCINATEAVKLIGMPDCDDAVIEATVYLALAPKSNAIDKAAQKAVSDVKKHGNLPVPLQIRNAPTKLMKNLNYGKGYKFAQREKDKLTTMKTNPPEIEGHEYYEPSEQGKESIFKQRLDYLKQWHQEHDPK
ncbi:replication-associated recombination protein A [Fructilactobacillus sp. Tb1]|uniref:replication-associated recombination protein A n=1 Tax=Fructilactobacillus sp. Tb1 TaxID=3422304 RepID=UPI003D285D7B